MANMTREQSARPSGHSTRAADIEAGKMIVSLSDSRAGNVVTRELTAVPSSVDAAKLLKQIAKEIKVRQNRSYSPALQNRERQMRRSIAEAVELAGVVVGETLKLPLPVSLQDVRDALRTRG